jgi:transposase
MDHFAGLDVSVKETSVCVVDDTGRMVREVKVASEPEALLAVLTNPACHFKRIGLEAGPLSQWLFSALADPARGGDRRRQITPHRTPSGSSKLQC